MLEAKNVTRHIGQLHIVKRMRSSVNGNPRYLVRASGWLCRTKPDSCIAYGLSHFDGKTVEATIGTYYGKATLLSVKLHREG